MRRRRRGFRKSRWFCRPYRFHHAVIGLVSAVEDPQPSAEDIEGVRELAHVAAPILVRLCTIEKLRSAVEERNALLVFAQMRSHLEANIAHELAGCGLEVVTTWT